MEPLNPESLGPRPRGYSQGMIGAGRVLFIAGQVGWDRPDHLVSDAFLAQFRQALANVHAVLEAAGGKPEDLGRVTIYVTDKHEYMECLRECGQAWRDILGKHYPAMSLVQVADLLEPGAKVEIEATAVLA